MQDFRHSYNRRCRDHDYRSRCIYMITMLKTPAMPVFSSISPDPAFKKISPIVEISPTGGIIYDCLDRLCRDYPALSILRRIAMPDHIHFELFVKERTALHLGSMMAAFKSSCTNTYKEDYPLSEAAVKGLPMFEPGFNDKIAVRAGAKDAFYNYIADNPRRYLVKKLCPDYFYHRLQLVLDGQRYGLYGNIFMLDNPVKSFVKISRVRRRTPDLASRIKEWEETIRCGGVLVSPFINPDEKHYRDEAAASGAGIILIVDYRFSDRRKPYKELFDLCAEGRLLIVSTEEYPEPPRSITHPHAEALNKIAMRIAALPPRGAILQARR